MISEICLPAKGIPEGCVIFFAHTSHIETGNTKVSLPALVKIANALGVSLDELVCDSIIKAKAVFEGELARTVSDCDELEIRVITDMAKTLKTSMRRRLGD